MGNRTRHDGIHEQLICRLALEWSTVAAVTSGSSSSFVMHIALKNTMNTFQYFHLGDKLLCQAL